MTCSIVASLACWRSVSRSGRFQSAQRAPLSQRAPVLSPALACLLPDLAPHLVEGAAGERDDVVGIEAERRLRAALPDRPGDPLAQVARDQLDPAGALGAELVEEPEHGLLVAALARPDQPAAVVVDDDGDVPLSLAEGELVDPDPGQPLERVTLPDAFVGDDPLDDPADRVPADPHQLADRRLRAVRRKPRHLLLERPA